MSKKNTGLVTVKRELLEAVKFFDDFPPSIQRMTNIRVVEAAHKYIEQADELLAEKDARIKELEKLLSSKRTLGLIDLNIMKTEQIKTLEAKLATKDARIEFLENLVEEQQRQIIRQDDGHG